MDANDRPATVVLEDGMVLLEAGACTATFTPEAAKVTAERLLAAVVEALAAREAGEA